MFPFIVHFGVCHPLHLSWPHFLSVRNATATVSHGKLDPILHPLLVPAVLSADLQHTLLYMDGVV